MAGAPSNGSNSQHLETFDRSSVTAALSAQALLLKGILCGNGPCIPHCCQPAWLEPLLELSKPFRSHSFTLRGVLLSQL